MNTYILQFFDGTNWQNYSDGMSYAVEFLFLNHAKKVAKDLAALAFFQSDNDLPQTRIHNWHVKSSQDEIFDID